jgi:hypothetical protein
MNTYTVTLRKDGGLRMPYTMAAPDTATLFAAIDPKDEVVSIVRIDDDTPDYLLDYLPLSVASRVAANSAFYVGDPNS